MSVLNACLTSRLPSVLGCDPAMGGIIAFYCQAFFAWRLRVLTGNNWIAAIVFFFGFCVMSRYFHSLTAASTEFGCVVGGLAIAAALGIQPELDEIASLAPVVYVWLVPAVCAVSLRVVYFSDLWFSMRILT